MKGFNASFNGVPMNQKEKSTILVVDEDKHVRTTLKMWLSNGGVNTLTASNGSDAVKMVSENQVDAALLDFRINKEDGISIAKKLKEVDNELKIIILTGFPSYETAVQAMKFGAFDYLSKGAPNEKIFSVVKKAITERERERAVKQQDTSGDKRIKMILFCNHSLIKERLENFTTNSSDFRLVNSFPVLNSLSSRNLSQEVHIALVCAGCNLKNLSTAYTIFPQLYRAFPGVKALIINENLSDQEKVELLRLGVRGFCSRDAGCEVLEKAILHVSKGELWVSRRVTQLSLAEMIHYESIPKSPLKSAAKPAFSSPSVSTSTPMSLSSSAFTSISEFAPAFELSSASAFESSPPPTKGNSAFSLTRKEREILKKITQGLKNKEIADHLFISETTVKTHINRILKKLGVDNRTKAILIAMERQII
ncbi:MAG: response regulator [Candidatus Aminicenantes bacterium]|nr:response regulator [Candidatus Aminicenantes bacterium]NIM80053.1 response regulator [Candidatus Aminicenantes bacterium]NIN19396.1 response regulator [Candidatus Aminicenantes bacterium]NIN43295.1 response regulator [Candidatus Aminicenantes bacterium]NIN86039.1 response regulator [Candidatus Aminicenantes bacterium]